VSSRARARPSRCCGASGLLEAIRATSRRLRSICSQRSQRIVRSATEREEQFAFPRRAPTLCRYFALKKAEEGVHDAAGFVRIARRTHKHLATRVGASRESVTKALKALCGDGLLKEQGEDFLLSPASARMRTSTRDVGQYRRRQRGARAVGRPAADGRGCAWGHYWTSIPLNSTTYSFSPVTVP